MSDNQQVHHITAPPSRNQPRSREQLEKANLKQRHEGFARYGNEIDEPLKVTAAAGGVYMGDADRFHTDVAGEERRRRDQAGLAQQNRLLAKRDAALARDEKRWEGMANEAKAEEDRMHRKRELGLASKKNAPSLPFNPITLEYAGNYSGGMLQHQDNMVKYRSALRTHNLYTRANGDFNPITGEERRDVAPPQKPQTPQMR